VRINITQLGDMFVFSNKSRSVTLTVLPFLLKIEYRKVIKGSEKVPYADCLEYGQYVDVHHEVMHTSYHNPLHWHATNLVHGPSHETP
jgi:hypothetical protein